MPRGPGARRIARREKQEHLNDRRFVAWAGVVALVLFAAPARAQQGRSAPAELAATRSPAATALALKMRAHPYLARTAFEAVENQPPYLFFVQRSSDAAARKAADVATSALALLDPVRARFESEIAKPLGLAQRADAPLLPVVVLRSRDAFDECYRATSGAGHFDASTSTFARDLGAAVIYDDPAEARAADERLQSAQHALVHALQCAYYAAEGPAPIRCWMFEGMADYLSRPEPGDALPAPARLSEFVDDAKTPETRWAHMRGLEEMCAVDEPNRLQEFFDLRTVDASLMPGPGLDPWTAFYREATLLHAFLASADDGKHRSGLTKWLGRAFSGNRSAEAFAASFAPEKLDELEREFLAWVQREHKRAFPGEKVKPEVVLAALSRAEPDALAAAGAKPEPKSRAEPEKTPTPVSGAARPPARGNLAPLSLADATADERLALAITEIGSGRLRAGRARLAGLLEGAEPAFAARVEREARRAEAWEAARDAFLLRLVDEKTLLPLDLGPRVTAKEFGVRSYSEGLVELDDKKGGIRRIQVETLDPWSLAREMRFGSTEGDWTRFYVFILRDRDQWKKLLKPDSEEAKALLADGREDYPARLELGKAMAKIAALADRPLPTTPRDADQRIDVFRSLLVDHANTSVVKRKRAQLRAQALALYERRFELLGPVAFLKGKLESLGSERVRITYAFDDPHELDDFESKLYPQIASRGLGTTRAKDVPFQVSKGALIALGQAGLRTLYDLGAPLTVRYDIQYEKADVQQTPFYFALGVCDDGSEHFAWAVNLSSLQVFETLNAASTPEKDSTFELGRPHPLELRHDGKALKLLLGGKQQCSLDAGARQYGAVFLRASTDLELRMDKLVLEGGLRPNGFERMKRVWAERQMAGL